MMAAAANGAAAVGTDASHLDATPQRVYSPIPMGIPPGRLRLASPKEPDAVEGLLISGGLAAALQPSKTHAVTTMMDAAAGEVLVKFEQTPELMGDIHKPGWLTRAVLGGFCYIDIDSFAHPQSIHTAKLYTGPFELGGPNLLLWYANAPRLAAKGANCKLVGSELTATVDMRAYTQLILQLSPGVVMGKYVPQLLEAGRVAFQCENYMLGCTPTDSYGNPPQFVDGYLTLDSMCRLVCMAQHCCSSAVIGSGYGEVAALFQLARQGTVLTFETVAQRRSSASELYTNLGIPNVFMRTYGTFDDTYEAGWPAVPTLIWVNNIRFTEKPILRCLVNGRCFPWNDSIIVSAEQFLGLDTGWVCFCGQCEQSGLRLVAEDLYVVRNSTIKSGCGMRVQLTYANRNLIVNYRVYSGPHREDLHAVLQPYGRGVGRYEASVYVCYSDVDFRPKPC